MSNKKQSPFGLWPSPISPYSVSQRLRFNDVRWDGSGQALVLHEGRGSQGVLVHCPLNEARRDLTPEWNVRGGVGYGGGNFDLHDERVIFCEKDGRLFAKTLGYGAATALTPAFGKCAAPCLSPDGRRIVYVYSDGETDLLALVNADGSEWPLQLVRGADFYMQPVWHPDNKHLAWIEWNHPGMPWDGTYLKLAEVAENAPYLQNVELIGGDEDTPVCQPLFSPDGRWLSFIISNGEWEDLVLYDLSAGTRRVLFHGEDCMFSEPAWVQGVRTCGWSSDSQKIFVISNARGQTDLWCVPLTGEAQRIDTAPYTWISQLSVSPREDQLAFVASAANVPERVVRWDGQKLITMARSDSENLSPDYFSQPTELEWQAEDGTAVYGWYYSPQNPEYTAEGLPPCIVHVHGGPTSAALLTFNTLAAYFTSRGYAWLEVNYRGSSGYGRSYMKALRLRWGDADTEDTGNAALALVNAGLADAQKLVIMGGSAGGYAVLNALVRYPGRFKAAVCNYGVSNLFTLGIGTHKFELHYNDSLVGRLPEATERYYAWSPIFHADQISDPLAVFQGDSDNVVPPAQSEEIVSALKRRGIPHIYKLYAGEGHGFRNPTTINDYYQEVERFLQQYVLFAPANP